MPANKLKVAILGGGMGALSSAWELLQQDPNGFDITVYQRGSRLGGKGASGRNRDPGKGLRVEEHGLHILMGFYDNAFHVLKNCYQTLGPNVVGPFEDALIGEDFLQLPDFYENGECKFWELHFPSEPRLVPGGRSPDSTPNTAKLFASSLKFFLSLNQSMLSEVGSIALTFVEHRAVVLLQEFLEHLPDELDQIGTSLLEIAIATVVEFVFRLVQDPEAQDATSVALRRSAMAIYFVGANLIGIMKHRLWSQKAFLDAAPLLDELDYKDWLRQQLDPRNGEFPTLSYQSPVVNALYDLIFSRCSNCPGGDPGFGAGTALYDSLMVLTYYWGHVFYRMNGGMGDVVFAPLYLHLRQAGVKFRFFQTVKELIPSADGARIERVVIEDQWHGPYEPLFLCNGRPCWSEPQPNDPPPGQQDVTEVTLQRGDPNGFDALVLGISVGGLRDERLTGALRRAHAPFDAMVRNIRTVATQSVQLWLGGEASDLGWPNHRGMLGSFSRPFDAWADMYQVLPHEQWSVADGVKSIAYLCDVYAGPTNDAAAAKALVRSDLERWLGDPGRKLWPNFDWNQLAASRAVGPARLDDQYWRVNLDPSDGYVLAAPGTSKFRLAPNESGFENLFLAGDWTKTDLNAGCLEAATKSGRAAARAIAALPRPQGVAVPEDDPANADPGAHPHAHIAASVAEHDYFDQDADWVLRHPVVISDADATVLLLIGNDDAKVTCRRVIESVSDGAYTATPMEGLGIVPVLLVAAYLPRVASGDPQHGQLGYFSENDVAFLVPVTLTRLADQQTSRGFLCPYIFVDSPIGLIAGREIFGLPKAFAKIRLHQQDNNGPFDLGVNADVLDVAPQPPKVQQSAIIGVTRVDDAATSIDAAGQAILEAVKLWLWPEGSVPGAVLSAPLFIPKQIRDGGAPTKACYHALLRCDLQISGLQGVTPMVQRFNVNLPSHSKPQIARQLGLDVANRTRVAFSAHFDLTFPVTQLLT